MRGHLVAALGLLLLAAALLPIVTDAPLLAAASPLPPDDDDDDEKPQKGPRLAPGKDLGLALTLTSGETRDVRPARVVALGVPAGTAPSPFLKRGPFRATWEGELPVSFKGDYVFSAAGRGKIKVEVNGKSVLEADGDDLSAAKGKTARLRKGANKFVVTYDSPSQGDAIVRLAWSSEDFTTEPLAPLALNRDAKNDALSTSLKHREGRELLANLRCLQCHKDAASTPTPAGMPELAIDAPSLADVGSRLNADWMARWIDDPKSLRPTATMPRIFHGPKDKDKKSEGPDDRARDIAAYLSSLGGDHASETPAPSSENVVLGGRLFAYLGCVGCHTLPDNDDWSKDPQRVPLRYVSAKWKTPALEAFLQAPDKHYAWIRMPNFHLKPEEAAQLAAYLTSAPAKDLAAPGHPVADASRGKQLVETSGCVNCHAVPGSTSKAEAPSFASLTPESLSRGCLNPTETADRKAPDFGLPDVSIKALQAFAKLGLASLATDSPIEFAERQVKALRCIACHKRDGYEDAWSDLKVETDRLLVGAPTEEKDANGLPYPADQVRPSLTWTGEKLKVEWAASFIAGQVPYKPRPYLRARMPAFANRAVALAHGLSLEHGYPTTEAPDVTPDPDLIPTAKLLVKNNGLNCVSCHNVGKVDAVGVFEAPGINFMYVKERIRPDYYRRWVRAPIRVEPDTKMPAYFMGDKSMLTTIQDGDANKQIATLWNYLMQGRSIESPGN